MTQCQCNLYKVNCAISTNQSGSQSSHYVKQWIKKAARVNFLHSKKAASAICGPFRNKEDKVQTSPDPS